MSSLGPSGDGEREYLGFRIQDAGRGLGVRWFGAASPSTGEHFEYTIHIAPPNPLDPSHATDRDEFAEAYGRRWINGVLGLGRYETGRAYREIRAPEWNPVFSREQMTDQDVQDEILTGLARVAALEELSGQPEELDLEGVAIILNVEIARVLEAMRLLVDDGLAERRDGGAGAHRITAKGQRFMDVNRIQRR